MATYPQQGQKPDEGGAWDDQLKQYIDEPDTANALAIVAERQARILADLTLQGEIDGFAASGLPPGGSTDQALLKTSGTDGDATWRSVTAGMVGAPTAGALTSEQTARTNADVAINTRIDNIVTGGGAGDMLKADLLSGLSDYPQARANLGLGNSAVRDVGYASSDVAAGDQAQGLIDAIPTVDTEDSSRDPATVAQFSTHGGTTYLDVSLLATTSQLAGALATSTLFDAKGDLPVGTGADTAAKLSAGTNGQVLAADSTTATGLKWVAAASGSGDMLKSDLLSGLSNYTTARANLGVAIGSNVEAWSARLDTLAGTTDTGTGSVVRATSPALVTPTGIVAADIASGVFALARGGTGQATAAAARGPSGLNIDQMTTVADVDKTIVATDRVVVWTSISAARVATLPAASTLNAGQRLWIGDGSGSASATNTITITRAGSDTINGATTEVIKVAYGGRYLVSDGVSKWSFDGGMARKSDDLSVFAATSSAQLRGVLSDETGTGAAVFATSPTMATPTLTSPVLNTGVSGTAIDTDVTLAANSDTLLASQKAIKAYIAALPTLASSDSAKLTFTTVGSVTTANVGPLAPLASPAFTGGGWTLVDATPAHGMVTSSIGTVFGAPIATLNVYAAATDAFPAAVMETLNGRASLRLGTGAAGAGFIIQMDASSNTAATLAGSLAFPDNGFTLQDNGDATKQAQFEASGITTATTRTLTIPDASGTLVLTAAAQTLSSKTLANTSVIAVKGTSLSVQDPTDTTKVMQFDMSGITTGTTRTLTVPNVSDTLVTLGATQTLTAKTMTSPVLNTPTISLNIPAAKTVDYTLVLGDASALLRMQKATAITLTIPANASVAFPIGTIIWFIATGAGTMTLAITTDTLAGTTSYATNKGGYIVKTAATTWFAFATA